MVTNIFNVSWICLAVRLSCHCHCFSLFQSCLLVKEELKTTRSTSQSASLDGLKCHLHDWTCSMEIPCSTACTKHTLSPLVKQSHEWSPPFHVKYVQSSPSSRTPGWLLFLLVLIRMISDPDPPVLPVGPRDFLGVTQGQFKLFPNSLFDLLKTFFCSF